MKHLVYLPQRIKETFTKMKGTKRKIFSFCVAVIIFLISFFRRPFGEKGGATGNESFSLLIFAIVLWISNPIPPFVTALLAPMLAVWLGVLLDQKTHQPLPRKDAADLVLSFMMNRIVVVVLGSFVLSRALKKALAGTTGISKWYLKWSKSGRSYPLVLLALIALPMYASALIPHEAATMLVFNLLSPVIFALPASSAVAKTSIYALMLGGNLGGMLSTISTPQNILLFTRQTGYQLTWSKWILVSLPVTAVAAIGCWLGLVLGWRAWRISLDYAVEPRPMTPVTDVEIGYNAAAEASDEESEVSVSEKEPLKKHHPKPMSTIARTWTGLVAIVTVFMWMSARRLDAWLGGLSAVSLFPLVALFGAGVLDRSDLQQLPWDVILLAMGATSLSSICVHSGLMSLIEEGFAAHLGSLRGWSRLVLLCVIMAFSGAVKSRYIAALVYLPLAFAVINADPQNASHLDSFLPTGQKILVAFACSAGMVLPISGLINATVSELREPEGRKEKYVKTRELVVVGSMGTVIALASIVTVGQFVINHLT